MNSPIEINSSTENQSAQVYFKQALSEFKDDANIQYLMVLALKKEGDYLAALYILEDMENRDFETELQLAILYLLTNNYEDATSKLVFLNKNYPANYFVLYNLLLVNFIQQKFEMVEQILPELIPLTSDANTLNALNLIESFLEMMKAVSSGKPLTDLAKKIKKVKDQEFFAFFALIVQFFGIEESLPILFEIQNRFPRNKVIKNFLANILFSTANNLLLQGDSNKARECLEKAKVFGSNSPIKTEIENMVGFLDYYDESYTSSLKHFKNVQKTAPKNPLIWQNLALVYEQKNNLSEAERYWENFLTHIEMKRKEFPPVKVKNGPPQDTTPLEKSIKSSSPPKPKAAPKSTKKTPVKPKVEKPEIKPEVVEPVESGGIDAELETAFFNKLKVLILDQLGVEPDEITRDTLFIEDLGADSLDMVEFVMACEEEFNIEISDEDVESISTIEDAMKYAMVRFENMSKSDKNSVLKNLDVRR